ncbi:hypothetical protein GCM10009593_44130 [Microlunatus antarcticus]|nr:right-handed parallel beta-helix repeat-containing protein [Microlunatus antarcticus]
MSTTALHRCPPGRGKALLGAIVLALLAGSVAAPVATAAPRAAAAPTSPAAAPAPTTVAPAPPLTPESFGAVGDGSTDDTAALQRSLDALRPGDTLAIGDGKVYRHTDILTVRTPDVRIVGQGTLLATNEARSEVFVDADRVEVDDITLRMQTTTRRWGAFEQMKLRLGARTGIVVRRVVIDGSAAAGIYLWGSSSFLLEDVQVHDTRADGIHLTGPTHDGTVRRALVERSGDDGVAVVSYRNDRVPVARVLIDRPTVRGNTWGRGVSVVGGDDITLRDVKVQASSAAAIYIASEGDPWNTFAPKRVRVQTADLQGSNTASGVDHGAFLIYSGNPSSPPRDISADHVTISDTRRGASSQVGVRADGGCAIVHVSLYKFTVRGGGNVFSANVPSDVYTRTSWVG